MPTVKISPELIPHAQFHKVKWLISPSQPPWYYFMKSSGRNKIANRDFLKSVDKPLRNLVKFLHVKGIETTPSCAGHSKRKKDFEKIYKKLINDETHIKNGGLELKDIETGKLFLYQDKNYILPWNRKTFLHHVLSYQQNGIIGIITGYNRKLKRKILDLKIEGIVIKEEDSIVFICTKKEDARVWKRVTSEIRNCFKEELK